VIARIVGSSRRRGRHRANNTDADLSNFYAQVRVESPFEAATHPPVASSSSGSQLSTVVTEQFDSGCAHVVLDDEIATLSGNGKVRTLYGWTIVPPPMSAPVGSTCPAYPSRNDHQSRVSVRRIGHARASFRWQPEMSRAR